MLRNTPLFSRRNPDSEHRIIQPSNFRTLLRVTRLHPMFRTRHIVFRTRRIIFPIRHIFLRIRHINFRTILTAFTTLLFNAPIGGAVKIGGLLISPPTHFNHRKPRLYCLRPRRNNTNCEGRTMRKGWSALLP